MAVYATISDAEGLYGTEYIATVCDRDRDSEVDLASFEIHLANASIEIDGYLRGRYPLPLTDADALAILIKYCVNIAIYNAAGSAPTVTDEMRLRYTDAISYLELVAMNKIKLVSEANKSASPQHMTRKTVDSIAGRARTFTRKGTSELF